VLNFGRHMKFGRELGMAVGLGETLDLSNTLGGGVEKETAIAAVAELLKGCSWLTTLILYASGCDDANKLKDAGITQLCSAIKANKETKLATLDISSNNMSLHGVNAVASMLSVSASLIRLSVSYNDLHGSGAAFGKALKLSSSLEQLEMYSCNLGPDDGDGLAAGIAASRSLLCLDLRDNKLRLEGVQPLAVALMANSVLTRLDLSLNGLEGSGEVLGEALKANSSLKVLGLYGCSLGPEDGKGLAGGIAACASLTGCDIRRNPFGVEGRAALCKAGPPNLKVWMEFHGKSARE